MRLPHNGLHHSHAATTSLAIRRTEWSVSHANQSRDTAASSLQIAKQVWPKAPKKGRESLKILHAKTSMLSSTPSAITWLTSARKKQYDGHD
jgi:hypothetical protein